MAHQHRAPSMLNDSLKQAWAEGFQVDTENRCLDPERWLNEGVPLAQRARVLYPFHPFPVGFIKVKRRLPIDAMIPHVRGLWAGAFAAIRDVLVTETVASFNAIVHWPYLISMLTPSQIFGQILEPDTILQDWVTHASAIQHTRAEQYLLGLKRRPPWHPYREATGAMRRAPLWGVLNSAIPAQAGALAYHDATVAQAGWGTWTAYVVAQVASSLCNATTDRWPLAAVFTETLRDVAGYQDAQPAALALLTHVTNECVMGRPWSERIGSILEPFAGYPEDHSLPNFAIVLAAVLSFPAHDPSDLAGNGPGNPITAVREAGWDAIGNSLVFGALQGIRHSPLDSLQTVPDFVQNAIQDTTALLR